MGFIKDNQVGVPAPGGIERPRGMGAMPTALLWEAQLTNDLLWALLNEEQRAEVLAKRSQ